MSKATISPALQQGTVSHLFIPLEENKKASQKFYFSVCQNYEMQNLKKACRQLKQASINWTLY